MAAIKFLVYALTILIPMTIIFAQETTQEPEREDRLFFNFPRLTGCNYTTEAGRTCRSCSQALNCLPSNVGLLTTCRGLFRNCNNGRCSLNACTFNATASG